MCATTIEEGWDVGFVSSRGLRHGAPGPIGRVQSDDFQRRTNIDGWNPPTPSNSIVQRRLSVASAEGAMEEEDEVQELIQNVYRQTSRCNDR